MKFAVAALLATTTVSAECMLGVQYQEFKDAECKTPANDAGLAPKFDTKMLEKMNMACREQESDVLWTEEPFHYKSMATTCDTSALTISVYKDAKCKGETHSLESTWGKCITAKVYDREVHYTFTAGAVTLQAAAAAALAFVGSQF